MALTNDQTYNYIKKCKYYKNTIPLDDYFGPLKYLYPNNPSEKDYSTNIDCLDLEEVVLTRKPYQSRDPIKEIYSSQGYLKGLPRVKELNFEYFGNNNNYQWKIVIILIIMIILYITKK